MSRKNKKTFIILVLLSSVVFMTLGYSLLSSRLTINSTNKVTGKWDIQIEKIEATDIRGNAVSHDVIISEDNLSAEFTVDLYNVGDYVEYTVVVKNKGNIKAKLNDIETSVSNSNEAIAFSNDALVGKSIDSSESMEFKVRIEVKNIDGEIQDSTDTIYKLTLDYLQDI